MVETHHSKARKRTAPSPKGRQRPDPAKRFDRSYYERYYLDPATRVVGPKDIQRLAAFVAAYLRYLDQPVRTILDLGCGVGHWKKAARVLWQEAAYTGVEFSAYLCQRYGWTKGSAADFHSGSRYDLVVCQGVLQYLDDQEAARAIKNFSRLCQGVLYLEALTEGDWENNVDKEHTDGAVHLRPAAWYRRRLSRHFRALGGGLHLALDANAVLYELEQP